MVKNKSGFVGVGAYGGNQVRPFYKESYPYGNVDDAEIEQLLSTTGAAIISKLVSVLCEAVFYSIQIS